MPKSPDTALKVHSCLPDTATGFLSARRSMILITCSALLCFGCFRTFPNIFYCLLVRAHAARRGLNARFWGTAEGYFLLTPVIPSFIFRRSQTSADCATVRAVVLMTLDKFMLSRAVETAHRRENMRGCRVSEHPVQKNVVRGDPVVSFKTYFRRLLCRNIQ